MTYGDVSVTVGPSVGLQGFLALAEGLSSFSSLVSLVLYLLLALGLYTIAQRRQISRAWLAFIPVANVWILGSIADQYQYSIDGVLRSRRKLLVILEILRIVLAVVFAVSLISVVLRLLIDFGDVTQVDVMEVLLSALAQSLAPLSIFLLTGLCCLIAAIFQWICYYQLFASCDSEKKVLFTVLGILLPFLMPIFVFACRNKDEAMPPIQMPFPE